MASSLVNAAETKVVGYVPNWGNPAALAEKIDYSMVTHLNVAFENPKNADGDFSFNSKDEVLIAKAHEHHVPVLVSIGGGGASTDKTLQARYFDLISEAKREAFARKLGDYVAAHHFDGVDVDIEGPSVNQDYGGFIDALAAVLEPAGKLLTAAVSEGYGGSRIPNSVFPHLTFVNIMAYDAKGTWSPNSPGQHSSMDFAKASVAYWLGRGVPKEKAVLGVPFYGYGFGEAFRKSPYNYNEIVAKFPGAENLDEVGQTIWYNGIPTIKAKTKYVRDENLGGGMIWSLDTDSYDQRSLLTAIHEALTAAKAP